jgi:hypothetical protein
LNLLKMSKPATVDDGTLRTFDTGATRDTSKDKLEPWGFLAPEVLAAFSRYMHKHRKQSDGSLRDADNWKKGIPEKVYRHSLARHFMDWWLVTCGEVPQYDTDIAARMLEEDGITPRDAELELLMAILFNVQGLARIKLQDLSF